MDTATVVRAQGGDEAAFSALVDATGGRLRGVAMSILRDHDLADEAIQRSLVGIWRNLPALRDVSRFDAWSYRLVVNACYSQIRSARPPGDLPIPAIDVWPVHDNPYDLVADHEVIERALARLPVAHRAVVTLHHQLGLTLERAAEVLGVPVGTVGSRLHRAMDGLRAAIEADERVGAVGPDPFAALALPARPRARPWVAGPVPPWPATADGRRIVVAQDGTGDVPTITDAVRMARDGDLVLVRPGTYRESVELRKDIAIVGHGDRDRIVLDFHGQAERAVAAGWDACPIGVVFDHTRASLVNVTIRGPRSAVAIVVDGGAPTIQAVAGVLDAAWQGVPTLHHFVWVTGDANGFIADCVSDAHFHVQPGSPTVERNDLGGAVAIVGSSSRAIIRDNTILVRTRTLTAVLAMCGAAPTIEGNEVSWFEGAAICLSSRPDACLDPHPGQRSPTDWARCSAAPIIRGNVIRDSRTGIRVVEGVSATIADNDIEATMTGILVHGADPVVVGNLLSGTAPGGIVLTGGSRASLERNAIDRSVHSRPVIGSPAVRPSITSMTGGPQ